MKCLLHIALLTMLAFGQSVAAAEEGKPAPKNKLAADFGACPDGHKALRDVPIVWGHFQLFTKNRKDYTDRERELAGKRDRGEIVFGGDIIPYNRPQFRVICGQCGYTYHPSDLSPEEQRLLDVPPDHDAFWAKHSKDPSGFRIPFTKRLLSFPTMKATKGTIDYSQSVSGDGKGLRSEALMFHSPLPIDQVAKIVREWLKANGRNPDRFKRAENNIYDYNKEGIWVFARDDDHFEPGKILISLMLTQMDANKTQQDKPR